MNRPRDTHTTTPEAAAAFERLHYNEPDDDTPTLAEAQRDAWECGDHK